ncbi:hypothetical protein [Liquorilactobacillus mali]|uniref:Uncharacterized protein n=1 Tax=Liquorilactobacillus mali KCTC 3596 = DSM 20444 TaxID=1046596 RepID=J1F3Z6_9LACO|nr:hypothetical protein [Liquorilactobacillus mali]EJF00331.1 hypothetical protein LMA_03633 [Liquorilactobacillus mali KCTC 3596 = DSM 20444]KRN08818.1 hypothetical protein FD00_GL001732 [Liquorilactobacillus mali KCTC 3596 = DSM 20444]QFQ74566.1 hypothetical protein LM596_05300 [Liquorilactobacillus mali]
MNGEKDYGKINDELLGVLVGTDGELSKRFLNGKHSKDYYVTRQVASELAMQAPEVLDSVQTPYLIVADSPNALIGKLVKHLIKTIKPEQTSDGKWRLTVPMCESHES